MFMISEEALQYAAAIKEKLSQPGKREECLKDIKKLREIKESHRWRADIGSCAGGLCRMTGLIEIETGILQDAARALENGDDERAAAALEDYIAFLRKHYQPERPGY